MIPKEHIPLAALTTLRVGGPARFVIACESESDVREAVTFAKEHALPFSVLGEGSNVLAYDKGYEGVVLQMRIPGIEVVEETPETITLRAGAGVSWDAFVREAASRALWGIENLAGIPGTVGAAPVQNIGAYGAEVRQTLAYVDAYDAQTQTVRRFLKEQCAFGYRDSIFKHEPDLIILAAAYTLQKKGTPAIGYADLARAAEEGKDVSTPAAVGDVVRSIRSAKFPDLTVCGTAGSFFKNPIISTKTHAELASRYGAIPSFPVESGVKVPLAFILDRVLNLRGFSKGNISLFGNQPLVLVATKDATAFEIDAFATHIADMVEKETGIKVEREVRYFPSHK